VALPAVIAGGLRRKMAATRGPGTCSTHASHQQTRTRARCGGCCPVASAAVGHRRGAHGQRPDDVCSRRSLPGRWDSEGRRGGHRAAAAALARRGAGQSILVTHGTPAWGPWRGGRAGWCGCATAGFEKPEVRARRQAAPWCRAPLTRTRTVARPRAPQPRVAASDMAPGPRGLFPARTGPGKTGNWGRTGPRRQRAVRMAGGRLRPVATPRRRWVAGLGASVLPGGALPRGWTPCARSHPGLGRRPARCEHGGASGRRPAGRGPLGAIGALAGGGPP